MLIRQTMRYLPAQVLAPAFQLLSMVAWTYWLVPHEMGSFVLVTATQEFVGLLTLSWFSVYALRYMPFERSGREREDYLHTETAIVLLSLPASLAAAAIAALIFGSGTPTAGSIAIVALFFASRGTNTHYSERARAQSNIPAYTILQVGGPVFGFLIGLAFVAFYAPTADMLLLAYGIAQIAASLIAAPMIGVRLVPRRVHARFLKAAIGYGGPVLVLSGLGWVAENNFRYIVEHMAGAAAFGLMAVGWGLGRRCASFGAMLVAAAAFPIAARLLNEGRRAEAMAQLATNAALLVGLLAPIVAGLMLVGGPATDLLIAEPYRETTRAILGLSALAGALRFLHIHVTDQLFVLERRIAYAGIVDIVEIAATVALTVAGLVWYGPVGGVIGNAVGSGLATLTSLALARRMAFRLPGPDLLKVAAATAVMAGALALLPSPESVPALVATIVAGMGVYGLAIAAAYAPQVRAIIARRLAGRTSAARAA